MASYEKGAGASGGVFFEEGAEAGGDRFDHFAGNGEEAGVAEVAGVILWNFVSLELRNDVELNGSPRNFQEMRGRSSD